MGTLKRLVGLSAWLALASACSDDPAFQSLNTLCDDLATDICDARAGGCCMGVDPSTCVSMTVASCQTQLSTLTAENLKYDSVDAADKRRTARPILDACGAPPALNIFFTGGLADGASCQRDAQCTGGLCTLDTHLCAVAPPPVLCIAP